MKKKSLYISRYMYILKTLFLGHRKVILTNHALKRAIKKEIDADMIEEAVLHGKQFKQKNKIIKFVKKYKNKKLVCVGERTNGNIIIKTVFWKK